jgi:hypothetical protein
MQPPQDIADTPRAMLPPLPRGAPTFYLTGRQPLRPTSILLAILAAVASLGVIVYAMSHAGVHLLPGGGPDSSRSSGANGRGDDDKDDPNQIDTIVLGDPTEAPVPAHHGDPGGDHASTVHPTILVVLPRSGDHFGQIPDSAAGHLLYDWLAAFNQATPSALAKSLPTINAAVDAQMELRRQTRGFTLLSAKEVQPGLLVFRLRDQAKSPNEVLGTLLMDPDSNPPAIASFSLRAVPPPQQNPTNGASAPSRTSVEHPSEN